MSTPAMSRRERIQTGDPITSRLIAMSSTRVQVHELLERDPCDLIYIDCQHGPYTEWDSVRICSAAAEMSTHLQLRIKHSRHVYRIGNYLDLGPLAIKTPEVEEESVVNAAFNAFYYLPVGRRRWGGNHRYNLSAYPDRRADGQGLSPAQY